MTVLISAASAFIVILSYILGLISGRQQREALLPVAPAKQDMIKRLEYEADQQAFTDCMSYSADIAYQNEE